MWGDLVCPEIHVISVPERRKDTMGQEKIAQKVKAENFPNLLTTIHLNEPPAQEHEGNEQGTV